MESGGGGSRRRRSLSDEKIDSPNLRDFLRVKDDDDDRRRSLSGLTLSAVLATEKRPQQHVNRTLLDIIRDDPNGGFKDNKKSWKAFKDKLRLRRAGAAWTSSVPTPTSDVPLHYHHTTTMNRMISRRNSTRFHTALPENDPNPESSSSSSSVTINNAPADSNPAATNSNNNRAMMLRRNSSRIPSLASSREGRLDHSIHREGSLNSQDLRRRPLSPEDDEEEEEGTGESAEVEEEDDGEGGVPGEPPVRMSLMALLAETDREMGLDGSAYMMGGAEGEDEEEEEEVEGGKEYNNCCVCMVRHKGSAFIPCGHTFCRLCSRELWVQRGNCPLCNGFILEILDIF